MIPASNETTVLRNGPGLSLIQSEDSAYKLACVQRDLQPCPFLGFGRN